jgi:hypothetical protein
MRSLHRDRTLLLALLLSSTGCSSNELDNPSFDLSCGGNACGWDVEQGITRQVATWNDHDKGLELVGNPVTISQAVSGPLDCSLEVELFGNVASNAELTVSLDAGDDGTLDYSVTVSALDWESEVVRLGGPSNGDAWRLSITKRGSGKVVLAHVFAEQDCGGDHTDVAGAE